MCTKQRPLASSWLSCSEGRALLGSLLRDNYRFTQIYQVLPRFVMGPVVQVPWRTETVPCLKIACNKSKQTRQALIFFKKISCLADLEHDRVDDSLRWLGREAG